MKPNLRKREYTALRATIRKVVVRHGYDKTADYLGINNWHVYMMVNSDTYVPSYRVCCQLNITKGTRPRRVALHCTDVDSAYATLTNPANFSREYVCELVDRLLKEYLLPFEA
jgi:hypothetical protein